MKIFFNVIAVLFLGWPASIFGYCCACIASGFSTGKFMYEQAENASIAKFTEVKK